MSERETVSFTLSKETITKLDKYAKALGMPRSRFLEWLLEMAYGKIEPNMGSLLEVFKETLALRKKALKNMEKEIKT
jgi:Ribbon-helix-helix protein, copG family.